MTPHDLLIASPLGAMAAALMCGAGPAPAQAPDKKPNIVFMLADNLGYGELGAYGGGILRGAPTPRIDSARRRRHAPAQLQRRSAMHALSVRAHDRPLRHPLRHLRSPDRRRPGWTDAVGGHHCGAAVGAGLRHRHVGQMAPRQRRRRGFPPTRASTSGTASRAPTTRRCGRR